MRVAPSSKPWMALSILRACAMTLPICTASSANAATAAPMRPPFASCASPPPLVAILAAKLASLAVALPTETVSEPMPLVSLPASEMTGPPNTSHFLSESGIMSSAPLTPLAILMMTSNASLMNLCAFCAASLAGDRSKLPGKKTLTSSLPRSTTVLKALPMTSPHSAATSSKPTSQSRKSASSGLICPNMPLSPLPKRLAPMRAKVLDICVPSPVKVVAALDAAPPR